MQRFIRVCFCLVFLYLKGIGQEKIYRARSLRIALDSLGGLFVKSGQFFANRPDLFGPEYRQEFEYLFENTTPEPWSVMKQVSLKCYGVSAEEYFDEFDTTVYRSASLAQTYRARHKGVNIMVKLKKPKVEDQICQDLKIAHAIARCVDLLTRGRMQARNIVQELEQWTWAELDYKQELENHQLCRVKHEDLVFSQVYIPKVFPKYSGQDVLVTEYIEGLSLDELMKQADSTSSALSARREVVNVILSYLVESAHTRGLFHADPHPSNILVTSEGDICFIDFGIIGSLSVRERTYVLQHVRSLISGDIEQSYSALLDVCQISRESVPSDLWEKYKTITNIFREQISIEEYFRHQEVYGPIFYRIIHLFQGAKIEMPVGLLRYFKTFQTVEGVIHRLDEKIMISDLVKYWDKISYYNLSLLLTKEKMYKKKLLRSVNAYISRSEAFLLEDLR